MQRFAVFAVAWWLWTGPAEAQFSLRLKSAASGPSAADTAKRQAGGRVHLLLEFPAMPEADQRRELERRGMRIVLYVPDNGLLVSAADGVDLDGLGLAWYGPLRPEQKLSPLLRIEDEFQTVLVEFHPDVDMADARGLLAEEQVELRENPDLLPNQLLVRVTHEQIARLALWDEVGYLFPAARELYEGQPVQACAGAITAQGQVGQVIARIGEGWDGPGRGSADIGYYFTSITARIPAEQVRAEIRRALDEWAKYAKLRFQPAASATAARAINIMFASGSHGDSNPFDGPGKVLAHTFYPSPPNPEPIAGDMHFDNDEPWQIGGSTDLFSVALHELGHALGLGHADKPSAVMYPYYRRVTGLSQDDIDAILELYAAQDAAGAPLTLDVTSAPSSVTAATAALSGTANGGVGNPRVTWSTDRGASGAAEGSRGWIIASAGLSPGANVFTITARDDAQAVATRTAVVTRQLTAGPAPVVRISSPAASGTYQTASATVTLTGTASPALVRITWSNSRGGSGAAVGTANWSAGPIALLRGVNTIAITATGADGNTGTAMLGVNYDPSAARDTTPPSISITNPAATNVQTSAAAISLSGRATDNVGVTQVSWATSTGRAGIANGTATWSISDVPLAVGATSIVVRAEDAAGNSAWRSVTVTRR